MADTIITILVFGLLAVFGLVCIGLLTMWGKVVARFVRWLNPKPEKTPGD